jgi:hypothetical protein
MYRQLNIRRTPAQWALLALALACAGCNDRPARYKVSGQVLIDGQPLTVGQMIVVPEDARRASAILDENGRFTLTSYDQDEPGDGVVPGTHKVGITAFENIGPNRLKWHAPKKYIDPETSGLTLTVTEDTENAVINLTWEGGKPFMESDSGDTAPAP